MQYTAELFVHRLYVLLLYSLVHNTVTCDRNCFTSQPCVPCIYYTTYSYSYSL